MDFAQPGRQTEGEPEANLKRLKQARFHASPSAVEGGADRGLTCRQCWRVHGATIAEPAFEFI